MITQTTAGNGSGGNVTLNYSYDGTLPTSETFAGPWTNAVTLNKSYDANARLSDRFMTPDNAPGGATDIHYAYDTDGRVSTVTSRLLKNSGFRYSSTGFA
jgi:hypothetical protein